METVLANLPVTKECRRETEEAVIVESDNDPCLISCRPEHGGRQRREQIMAVHDVRLLIMDAALHFCHGCPRPDGLHAGSDHLEPPRITQHGRVDVNLMPGFREESCFVLDDTILSGGWPGSIRRVENQDPHSRSP
jgi:hypothetical protein